MLSCASRICLVFPSISHFQFIFLRTSSPSIYVEWRCVSTLKSPSALGSLEKLLPLETGVGPSAQKVAADGLLTVGPLLPHAYQVCLLDIVYPHFFETLHNPLASVSFCYGEQ
jgi:hypothetical protein